MFISLKMTFLLSLLYIAEQCPAYGINFAHSVKVANAHPSQLPSNDSLHIN